LRQCNPINLILRWVYRYLILRRAYEYLILRWVYKYLILRPYRGKNTQLGRAAIWVDSNCNGKGIRKVNMLRALRIS
jgi:hypothetical protein